MSRNGKKELSLAGHASYADWQDMSTPGSTTYERNLTCGKACQMGEGREGLQEKKTHTVTEVKWQ